MSKRQEEKEKLARLLDEGRITEAVYDERMARMGHHVSPSRKKWKKVAYLLREGRITQAIADSYLRQIEATGTYVPVGEWRPGEQPRQGQ